MNHCNLCKQNGQALLEAVFMMLVLVAILFAIQSTGQLRSQSLDLLGESSYQTFLLTQQKSARTAPPSKLRSMGPYPVSNTLLERALAQQLLEVHHGGLVTATSAKGVLHRTSYLLVNAGQSDSAIEAQQRIEHSKDAWVSVAGRSQRHLTPFRETLRRMDSPWGRPVLKTDWLRGWAGQFPATHHLGALR